MNLKEALIKYDSIRLNVEANTWEEAVMAAIKPLEEAGCVKTSYKEAIIKLTKQNGPYYVLMPGMAMPHARPEDGVITNSFSLVVLKKPVMFDQTEVSVLLALAATSSDIHASIAIPQIIGLFELENIIDRLKKCQSSQEILELVDQANFDKYIKE